MRRHQIPIFTAALTLVVVPLAVIMLYALYWYRGNEFIDKSDLLIFGAVVASILAPVFLGPLVYKTVKLRDLSSQLREAVRTDPLTRIPNRLAFFERVEELSVTAGLSPVRFSLLIADVDHFKEINDTYGHQAGDLALVQVASLLSETTKEMHEANAIVARIGGEEFAIFVRTKNSDEVLQLADRLCSRIRECRLRFLSQIIPMTISIGINLEADPTSIADAMRVADDAVYAAKAQGRNRWVGSAFRIEPSKDNAMAA